MCWIEYRAKRVAKLGYTKHRGTPYGRHRDPKCHVHKFPLPEETRQEVVAPADSDIFVTSVVDFESDDGEIMFVFDNRADDEMRDADLYQFCHRIAEKGGVVLARQSYPRTGPDAGHTVCIAMEGLSGQQVLDELAKVRECLHYTN